MLSTASVTMATMWYLTKEESQTWCEGHALVLDDTAHPIIKNRAHSVTVPLSEINWSKLTWLSGFVASYLEPFDECDVRTFCRPVVSGDGSSRDAQTLRA